MVSSGSSEVVIVDDDASVRRALRRLLKAEGYAVQTHSSAEKLFVDQQPRGPSCILLDVNMPGRSGPELQQWLKAAGIDIPIVFMTGYGDVGTGVSAMKRGAVDFLTKPIDDTLLLEAVERALREHKTRISQKRENDGLRSLYNDLTDREQEVFAAVAAGLMNKESGSALGIAEKTIKVHRARVMKKMQAHSAADLVRAAEQLGIHWPGQAKGAADPDAMPTSKRSLGQRI
jgi:FixJ family two-component response regulator